MSQHAVVHFEIGGPDGKALQDFYGKLFGWSINADNPMNYAIVFKMDNGIGGGLPQSQDGTPFVTFYVTCGDDVEGKLKEAEQLGATRALEPTQIEGGPQIAAFRDPDDNLVGLVSGTPTEEAPMTGGGDPVAWFEIGARDGAKLQKFYSDLFGWKIDANNPMQYGMTEAIGNGIGGGIGSGIEEPYVTIYVAVPDLQATLDKAAELGGKTVMEPADVPGGPTIAQFSDVAGNVIGLLKPSGDQAG